MFITEVLVKSNWSGLILRAVVFAVEGWVPLRQLWFFELHLMYEFFFTTWWNDLFCKVNRLFKKRLFNLKIPKSQMVHFITFRFLQHRTRVSEGSKSRKHVERHRRQRWKVRWTNDSFIFITGRDSWCSCLLERVDTHFPLLFQQFKFCWYHTEHKANGWRF